MSMIHINNPSTKSNLTATLDDKCIQPNAVDLPVKDVFKIDGGIVDLDLQSIAPITKIKFFYYIKFIEKLKSSIYSS